MEWERSWIPTHCNVTRYIYSTAKVTLTSHLVYLSIVHLCLLCGRRYICAYVHMYSTCMSSVVHFNLVLTKRITLLQFFFHFMYSSTHCSFSISFSFKFRYSLQFLFYFFSFISWIIRHRVLSSRHGTHDNISVVYTQFHIVE